MWKCVFICVIFVTSSTIAKLPENKVLPCSSNRAGSLNNFRCQNGTGCIDIDQVCDGIRHCPDSSDEISCPNPMKRSKRAGVCILPAYPKNGRYEVLNNQNAGPGQSFNSVRLTVFCRRGYGVVDTDGSDRSHKMFCIDGVWEQNMPQCVRFCKLNPDPSVRYMCYVPGVGLKVCGNYVAPGTLVNPVCNTPIYYSTENFSNMKCQSGFWNYVAKCKVECGRVTPEAFQLIIDGQEAKRGELPWHVGIYRKEKNNNFEQICGGSLVSNKVVISAAHCFWSDFRKLLPAANYRVAIGKLYRAWNSEEDVDAQKAEIQQIKIPGLFEGAAANFQEDIAVLILTTPFIYKTYIRPVCLNFNTNFERWQLQPEKFGKVAGWGLTSANGVESPILKVVDMPFITEVTCVNTLPLSFRPYITGDKFCAGYTNGTALCKGDSGRGLAFPDQELGIDRFYLRGIVSASPRSDDKSCNNFAYTTFTKITKHQEMINEAIAESVDKVCPYYSFQCDNGTCLDQGADCNGKQDCADGSDESEELCGAAIENDNTSLTSIACVLPPYPNHGTYVVTSLPNARPGLASDAFVLTVTCSEGYQLIGTDGEAENSSTVFCSNGIWSQTIPKCVRVLPSVQPSYEWENTNGKCISARACLSGLQDTDRPTAPLCTSNDASMIYCTDCKLVNDKGLLLFDPVLGIMTKTGTSKAKDKCLDYIHTLDYPCKKDENIRNDTIQLDTTRNCISKNNNEQSGEPNIIRRDALRGEFPFLALLAGFDRFAKQVIFKCAGTVISERYILTSIYCNREPTRYAAIGILKRSDSAELWQRYDVKGGSNHNGIALLQTEREITFSSTILPACLHADGEMDKGAYVTGWDHQAHNLHTTYVTGLSKEECERQFPPNTDIVRNIEKLDLMCFVQKNGNRTSCQVGTGSPLLSRNHQQCAYTVVGVLAYVRTCGVKGGPGMYIGIKENLPWIEKVVWG